MCDSTAEWLRSENLTASLVRQRYENPDEVFFPLPSQRTCELTEIFSAPRRRERAKGSGEWTPVDCAEASAAHAAQERAALAAQAAAKESVPPNALVLMGVEGEYMGEVMGLSVVAGAGAPAKTILLGRSSSCDVTLGRDDQVSRAAWAAQWTTGRRPVLWSAAVGARRDELSVRGDACSPAARRRRDRMIRERSWGVGVHAAAGGAACVHEA